MPLYDIYEIEIIKPLFLLKFGRLTPKNSLSFTLDFFAMF